MKPPTKYLVVVFLIGWFIGAACGGFFLTGWHSPFGHHPSARMRERFYRELNLNATQKTQVEAILQRKHERIDQVLSEADQHVDEIRRSTREEIRTLLDAQQQAAFDKIQARRAAHAKDHHGFLRLHG